MSSNTKLILIIQNFYNYLNKKFTFFKIYFTNGIFFLFFGFLIGNLFGSLLNIFNRSIILHPLVTILIIFFVEIINYIIYHNKDRALFFIDIKKFIYYIKNFLKYKLKFLENSNLIKKISEVLDVELKHKLVKKSLHLNDHLINIVRKILLHIQNSYTKICIFVKKIFIIKTLNLFKIGILLGFFIDAFKVGS